MVSELKINIIRRIAGITEVSVLEDIDRLLDLASESESGYILTEKEKEAVDAGLNDLKENKVFSSEEADDMIKAWLKG